MPGFTSLDNFLQATTQNGKFFRSDWNKNFNPTVGAAAGEWHSLFRGGGNPAADAILNTGTNLTWQQLRDTTPNATGILHGGNVSPDYKSIVNVSAFSASGTTMPCVAMLVDLLGFYRVTTVTTATAQATINTLVAFSTFAADASTDTLTHTNINLLPLSTVQVSNSGGALPVGLVAATNYFVIRLTDTTCKLATTYANAAAGISIDITDAGTGTHTINTLLPRYTNGAGVQALFLNSNATALGAATPNLSLGYTSSVAVAARATPATLPIGKTAASNSLVLYSGTGAGKYGPAMPLAAGDGGIRSIETIQNSVSYVSGEYSVVLYRPLVTLPMTTIGVAAERDLMNQVPSLPRVYDGACLTWLLYSGAATPANSAFFGHIDYAWA